LNFWAVLCFRNFYILISYPITSLSLLIIENNYSFFHQCIISLCLFYTFSVPTVIAVLWYCFSQLFSPIICTFLEMNYFIKYSDVHFTFALYHFPILSLFLSLFLFKWIKKYFYICSFVESENINTKHTSWEQWSQWEKLH
jgi:hypothetical protein